MKTLFSIASFSFLVSGAVFAQSVVTPKQIEDWTKLWSSPQRADRLGAALALISLSSEGTGPSPAEIERLVPGALSETDSLVRSRKFSAIAYNVDSSEASRKILLQLILNETDPYILGFPLSKIPTYGEWPIADEFKARVRAHLKILLVGGVFNNKFTNLALESGPDEPLFEAWLDAAEKYLLRNDRFTNLFTYLPLIGDRAKAFRRVEKHILNQALESKVRWGFVEMWLFWARQAPFTEKPSLGLEVDSLVGSPDPLLQKFGIAYLTLGTGQKDERFQEIAKKALFGKDTDPEVRFDWLRIWDASQLNAQQALKLASLFGDDFLMQKLPLMNLETFKAIPTGGPEFQSAPLSLRAYVVSSKATQVRDVNDEGIGVIQELLRKYDASSPLWPAVASILERFRDSNERYSDVIMQATPPPRIPENVPELRAVVCSRASHFKENRLVGGQGMSFDMQGGIAALEAFTTIKLQKICNLPSSVVDEIRLSLTGLRTGTYWDLILESAPHFSPQVSDVDFDRLDHRFPRVENFYVKTFLYGLAAELGLENLKKRARVSIFRDLGVHQNMIVGREGSVLHFSAIAFATILLASDATPSEREFLSEVILRFVENGAVDVRYMPKQTSDPRYAQRIDDFKYNHPYGAAARSPLAWVSLILLGHEKSQSEGRLKESLDNLRKHLPQLIRAHQGLMAHTGSKAGVAPYFYAFCLSILGTAGSQLEDAGARQDIQSTVELALKMSLRQEKNGWGFVQMSNPIWNEISRPIVDPLLSLAATGLLTQGR